MPTLCCQAWLLPMSWATELPGRGRDCASLARGRDWSKRALPQGSMPSLGLAGPSKFRQPESSELKAKRSGLTPAPPPNSFYMTLVKCSSSFLHLCISLYSREGFLPCLGKHIETYEKASVFSSAKGESKIFLGLCEAFV